MIKGLAWRAGTRRFAGRAVTVHEETTALGEATPEDFAVGKALQAAGAGQVLVFDISGEKISSFGGLTVTAARERGIEGVIVDGGCRDLEELRDCGLGVISRWVTPVSARERVRVIGINVPVTCGGVPVVPGDYVIGDETGAVVVPAARFDETLDLAKRLDVRDRRFLAALRAGQEFSNIAETLGPV